MHTDYDNIDEILLKEMSQAGFITESKSKLYSSRKKLHESSNQYLTEAESSTPHEYYTMGQMVTWDQFKRVYMDYENYPRVEDVMSALGLPKALFSAQKDSSYTRKLNTIRQHFVKNNLEGSLVDVHFNDRKKEYYLDQMPQASRDRVNPGRRGEVKRSTNVVTYLNDQEVVPGEFYSDISRIPRRKWGSWVKFWERQVSRIKNPKSIVGRVWAKTFLMGYQFSKNVVIEIWYNSATSDFSLYDHNGAELGRPAKTLQEAVKYFITHLLRTYESDKKIFQGGVQDIAGSYLNALRQGIQKDAIEAERESKLADKEKRNQGKIQNVISRSVNQGKDQNIQKHHEADAKRKEMAKNVKDTVTGKNKKDKPEKEKTDWDEARGSSIKDKVASSVKKARGERGHEWDDPAEMQKKKNKEREEIIKRTQKDNEETTKRAQRDYEARTSFNPYEKPSGGTETTFDPTSGLDFSQLMRQYNDALSRYETQKEELDQMKREMGADNGDGIAAITPEDIENKKQAISKIEQQLAKAKERMDRINKGKTVNEAFGDDQEDFDEFVFDPASNELDREAISRRKAAEQSGFTTTAIKTATMGEMLKVYNETKVKHKNVGPIRRWLDKSRAFRGRKARIVRPQEKAGVFDRMRMAFFGGDYRADFVIGFSLKDAVNIEIWYVTSPSSDAPNKTDSSFYVYDVTAEQVVRSDLPYYRNALQTAIAKVGIM